MFTADGDGTIALVDELWQLIGVVAVDIGSILFGIVTVAGVVGVVGTCASFNSKSSTSRLLMVRENNKHIHLHKTVRFYAYIRT